MEVDIIGYVEQIFPELRGCFYPVFTTDLGKITVAYSFSPVSGGHIKQSSLELKIIGGDFDQCEEVRRKLEQVLDMEEDSGYVTTGGTRFHSQLAGGGCLYSEGTQRWEDTAIYMIDWRHISEK